VLDIFRKKTSPAFEVALQLGALYANGGEDVGEVLAKYSESLGIAYQVRDDLEDLGEGHAPDDINGMRPSLPLALALERAVRDDKATIDAAWKRAGSDQALVRAIITRSGAEERCHGLLDSYKEEAIRSLAELENPSLKGLLRRVVSKIFGVEIKGWCSEFEARNAAGRAAVPTAAG
jgi:geranylgeranyl diphosphate synthase type II